MGLLQPLAEPVRVLRRCLLLACQPQWPSERMPRLRAGRERLIQPLKRGVRVGPSLWLVLAEDPMLASFTTARERGWRHEHVPSPAFHLACNTASQA